MQAPSPPQSAAALPVLLALALALAAAAAEPGDIAGGKGKAMKPMPKKPQRPMLKVQPGDSAACRLMWPLWKTAARSLGGGHDRQITADSCTNLHEFYTGPIVPAEALKFGFAVPRDALAYIQVYKCAGTEILCNLRRHFGQRERWRRGRNQNPLHQMLGMSLFPLRSPLGDEEGWKGKYYHDTPEDIARAEDQGRGPRGVAFTFVRDPAARFVSGVAEIEYYLTVGEPEEFGDMVLGSQAARSNYEQGGIIRAAKAACRGCTHFDLKAGSEERATRMVLDLVEGRMAMHFLWRHVASQVAPINLFTRNVGPMDLIGQLESFEEGWESIEAIAGAGAILPPFNRSCRGHSYSSAESKFEPRETMRRMIQQERPDGAATRGSDVALALGCAVLLPDYACFGYTSVVNGSDCVAGGYAKSLAEWSATVEAVQEELCPSVMARDLEGFAHVKAKSLEQDLGSLPMPSPAPTQRTARHEL
ncbi:unnamed protein product [Prorocentrum cordatum]|uniref:Sulfotransferase n=1 Tax=Prorocentrum cordatum TaxID=2364126 RepID=A0ABN9RR15_9DINO|nr:unnamed protein product [Polarella glacialis]